MDLQIYIHLVISVQISFFGSGDLKIDVSTKNSTLDFYMTLKFTLRKKKNQLCSRQVTFNNNNALIMLLTILTPDTVSLIKKSIGNFLSQSYYKMIKKENKILTIGLSFAIFLIIDSRYSGSLVI